MWPPLRRVAAYLAASLILAWSSVGAAPQAPMPSPDNDSALDAITQVLARNATLHDYTFDLNVHVALLTFPWIRFSMSGHGEYTRDGAYEVHFDHVPWFGRGFETISMASLDPKTWPGEYTIALAKPQGQNRILSMHDRKQTPLRETLVTIGTDSVIHQILWNYQNGGHVRLSIVPTLVSGYALPRSEDAEIVMAAYRAIADATFTNYRVNAAVTPTSGRSAEP